MVKFCLGAGKFRRRKLSKARPERNTDLYFTDVVMANNSSFQGSEACLIEAGKFVGTTAKFDASWNVVPLRPDLRAAEYFPSQTSL
jgi:hypothetical protein